MLLLLPLTLLSTSMEKRAGIGLALSGGEATLPDDVGLVEDLRVERTDGGFAVLASVRSTDVRAQAGDVEHRRFHAADLSSLGEILSRVKQMDPTRTRATLAPLPGSSATEVVQWMDVLRSGAAGPLFPRVVLETQP